MVINEVEKTPAFSAPQEKGNPDIASGPVVRIRPTKGIQFLDFPELWRYRELLATLVWRDITIRYKQAALGVAWAILQPLLLMVVFSIFFGRLAGMTSGSVPYPLFVLSGIIVWYFFANSLAQASASVIGAERLITKIYFPRISIPFAAIGAAFFDFVMSVGLLGAFLVYYGAWPSRQIVLAPLFMLVVVFAAAGLGILLAALTVAYRDFRFVTPFLVQIGMYATPTVYMAMPESPSIWLRIWLCVNPVAAPIAAFRSALLGGPIPWTEVGISALIAVSLFVFGCIYFRSVEDSFADRV